MKFVTLVNKLYSPFPCHRLSERSISFKGQKFNICARCMAIYPLYLAYPALLFIVGFNPLWALVAVLLSFPLVADGYTQKMGYRKSSNPLRIFTGASFGLGQAVFIAWSFKFILHLFNF